MTKSIDVDSCVTTVSPPSESTIIDQGSKFPSLTLNNIFDNNEPFIEGYYNVISVLVRAKDKYINIGKLCREYK